MILVKLLTSGNMIKPSIEEAIKLANDVDVSVVFIDQSQNYAEVIINPGEEYDDVHKRYTSQTKDLDYITMVVTPYEESSGEWVTLSMGLVAKLKVGIAVYLKAKTITVYPWSTPETLHYKYRRRS